MLAGEAALDVVAVVLDVSVNALAECMTGLLDGLVILAHCLGAEVGVGACAVPVASGWLGIEADDYVVVLSDAVQQPTGYVHVIAHGECVGCADLELPLAGHHFGIGAFDHQASIEARLSVLFDDLAAHNTSGANAAVVRALRGREAVRWEAQWSAIKLEHGVFLLNAVDHLLLGVLLRSLLASGAGVGWVWLHVGRQQHVAQHQDVGTATNWVWT